MAKLKTAVQPRIPVTTTMSLSPELSDNSSNDGALEWPAPPTTRVYMDMGQVILDVPKDMLEDEEEVKEWIWQNHKRKLLDAMIVKHESEKTELQKVTQSLKLLDNIAKVQRQYLQMEEPKVVFGTLLDKLLELMDSEYGFIGEVKHREDGSPFLMTHAITNIAWDKATNDFYEENVDRGLEFGNMNSLFGHVIVNAEPVIANEPKKHPSSCGIPSGHPPLNHFLGIPFFEARGAKMNGMVGIANKPGGYSEADIEFLEPFTVTCSNLIQAYNAIRENKYLINTLEEKVADRTKELQLANECLEDANRRVVQASQAQLQHFACMSHEIRTPLNCIIGLSSLLQDTDLNPYQQDSLRMIVTSGDLLLTVVNDVLDYSKLESGNVDIDIKRSNLQEALDAVVHSIQQKARSKNLSVNTFYCPDVPGLVETDSRRLQQILYNLLGNAIKFSKESSSVELRVEVIDNTKTLPSIDEEKNKKPTCPHHLIESDHGANKAPPNGCPFHASSDPQDFGGEESKCPFTPAKLESSLTSNDLTDSEEDSEEESEDDKRIQSDRILRFSVKDYGTGISKKDFGRIFKPFKQANSFTEQLYGGTGLGLAITSKLVKGLGGKIWVDSVEGEWSCFTVDFPFDEPAPKSKPNESLENLTILSVNDEAHAARVEKDLFGHFNLQVFKFSTMGEVAKFAGKKGNIDTRRVYICLVQEDLYKEESYNRLSEVARSVLLTFGPNYTVKQTAEHYRSLSQVLPSVLIQSFVKHMKASASRVIKAKESKDSIPIACGELKVLIAEDNLINQKVLVRMLSRLGITNVDVVDNGQKAVDREAEHQDYDIVYMDMQMPVMDGVDATKHIVKRRGDKERPKVVFVTANVAENFEAEAQEAGGDGFISKPFSVGGIQKSFNLLR